jgi:hypothetical protein
MRPEVVGFFEHSLNYVDKLWQLCLVPLPLRATVNQHENVLPLVTAARPAVEVGEVSTSRLASGDCTHISVGVVASFFAQH